MTIQITPITDADVPAVSDFLHANHNARVPWIRVISEPWKVKAPNHGFMLWDGQRVLGTYLAFYSERTVAGQVERFCNLHSWCVLPDFRSHSIRLLLALLAQDGFHFTDLSANADIVRLNALFKFRTFDTPAVFVPNVRWPNLPHRTRISTDRDIIATTLSGAELQLYHDHAQAAAARHLVLIRGRDSCYVMFREQRWKDVPCALILHVGNPELFRRAIGPLTRHLLVRHRLQGTLADLPIFGRRPRLSLMRPALWPWPKMYRSATLEPRQIDCLYSELVCVPW
jgi:hypothetical protein